MKGLFKKKKAAMSILDRLICNTVENHLIKHYIISYHDPEIPVHKDELGRELKIDVDHLYSIIHDNCHPCLEFCQSENNKKEATWFVKLRDILI